MGEPSTSAKIRLNTSKGDVNIELWCKECPKTTRWFLDQFHDKKYKKFDISKFIKNEYVQVYCGQENDNYETPGSHLHLKKEINPRLRFTKRGLLCFGNIADKMDRTRYGFFITLKPMPLENGNYTIFGKITDSSIYNIVKISESEMDENTGMPIYATIVLGYEILVSYFKEDHLAKDLQQRRSEDLNKQTSSKITKKTKRKVQLLYETEDDNSGEEEDFVVKIISANMPDKKIKKDKKQSKKMKTMLDDDGKKKKEEKQGEEFVSGSRKREAAPAREINIELVNLSEKQEEAVDDKEAHDVLLFNMFDKKLEEHGIGEENMNKDEESDEEALDFLTHRVEFD